MKNSAIYEKVTKLIIEKLENGIKPWNKPWIAPGVYPMNLITRKPYRGFNSLLLSSLGFESPYFLTWNQIKKLGGAVKKGEASIPIVFWKFINVKTKDEKTNEIVGTDRIPLLKYYNVFNIDQTIDIDSKHIPVVEKKEYDLISEAEAIIAGYPNPPRFITHDEDRAFYRPSVDAIFMPDKSYFKSIEMFYSVKFHEAGHSTGHEKRLNRNIRNVFGSHAYSLEELVAEMTAAFLCGSCGFEAQTLNNTVAYLDNWASALKDNPNWLIQAAGKAQKAADYILGINQNYEQVDSTQEKGAA